MTVLEIITEETGKEVSPETRLDSLGLDSLEFVAMMLALSRNGFDVPSEKWPNLETVAHISHYAVGLP